jgi:polysaccharide export outer membrane protein
MMNRMIVAIMFLVLGYSGICTAADKDHYRVNSGDSLFVSVWQDEGLTREVLVAPDGNCTFPLVGEFGAKGRTLSEIRSELSQRLARFIPDAVVTVALADISGNKIYVMGQVNSPGVYVMNPSLDVMQALSMAGGTTPFADLKSIRILRRDEAGQRALRFRYDEVIRGRNLEQNILLQSGDLLVVP